MDAAIRDWEQPTSIKDAEDRKDKTLSQLFNVDAQLNSKHLTDETGKRYDSAAYHARRQALLKHKTRLLKELKRLKAWIHATKDNRPTTHNASDAALLRQAYTLLTQLKEDGVDFDEQELLFIDYLASRVEG